MQDIMIIKDSSLIRLGITNLLKAHGYNYYVTFGLADAIVRNLNLYLENVDLLLADLKPPGISDIEFDALMSEIEKSARKISIL